MNYYNEFEPKAAAWLRELIRRGLIPKGHVDERSIADVTPGDLAGYTQCHWFAGIGGWSLALRLAGWPDDKPVWTGSCPCQPFSCAGKGKAQEDERHLWPEMFRLVRECRPHVTFGEQVPSAIGHGWLDGISSDLEGEGYAVGAVVLGAHSVGAPHIRQRLYWVAHRAGDDAGRLAVPGQQSAGRGLQRSCEGPSQDASGTSDQFGGSSVAGGLPDAGRELHEPLRKPGDSPCAGRETEDTAQKRERGRAAFGGSGENGRLPDAQGRGCGEQRGENQPGSGGRADCGFTVGGMGQSNVNGRDARGASAEAARHGCPIGPDGSDGGANPERMGESIRSGLEGYTGHGNRGDQPGRIDTATPGPTAAAGGACGWLGHAKGDEQLRNSISGDDRERQPDRGSSRVGDFWSRFQILHFKDGKTRRVEPGTFPLVDGFPARVDLLRGLGNAIVPQVAAEFIQAYLENVE